MKKSIAILSMCLLLCVNALAQSRNLTFELVSASIAPNDVRKTINSNLTTLLVAINQAYLDQEDLDLTDIAIEVRAKMNLEMLWKNMHFYCKESDIMVPLCIDVQGYQVRDIKITLAPLAIYDGLLERELTISLDRAGVITGVRMSLENNLVKDILQKQQTAIDTRQRLEIMKFIEDYRSYFNAKNLAALEKLYSDDALFKKEDELINNSGSTMEKRHKRGEMYIVDYLNRVKRMFARKDFIDVEFDQVQIQRHPTNIDFYGVTLHQNTTYGGKNDSYSDCGWLFWFWDFTDRDHPVIHIRTWQTDEDAQKNGVFELSDFEIL